MTVSALVPTIWMCQLIVGNTVSRKLTNLPPASLFRRDWLWSHRGEDLNGHIKVPRELLIRCSARQSALSAKLASANGCLYNRQKLQANTLVPAASLKPILMGSVYYSVHHSRGCPRLCDCVFARKTTKIAYNQEQVKVETLVPLVHGRCRMYNTC